jgi:hypothetical protein
VKCGLHQVLQVVFSFNQGFSSCLNLIQPRIGRIDKMLVQFEQGKLFAASLETGCACFCDPKTGKVHKDPVIFRENGEQGPVSCLKMGFHRLVVGFMDGRVCVVNGFKEGAGMSSYTIFSPQLHRASVTSIEILQARDGSDIFYLSCSSDGRIGLWRASDLRLLKVFVINGDSVLSAGVDSVKKRIIVLCENSLALLEIPDWSSSETAEQMPSFLFPHTSPIPTDGCKQFLLDSDSDLVFVPLDKSIYVYDLKKKEIACKLGFELRSKISCICWDGESESFNEESEKETFRRRCALIVGTSSGHILIWDISRILERKTIFRNVENECKPFIFNHVAECKATCVQVDAFKVVVGYADGFIKVFDLLNGHLLQALHSKYFRSMEASRRRRDVARSFDTPVHCVLISTQVIVCGIENQVRIWNFDPENLLSLFKGLLITKNQKNQRKRLNQPQVGYKSPRAQLQYVSKQELKESNRILHMERLKREKEKKDTPSSSLGLSEAEMIAYARFLSMEQQQVSGNRPQVFPEKPGSSASVSQPVQIKPLSGTSDEEWPKLGSSQKSNQSWSSSVSKETTRRTTLSPSARPRKLSFSQFLDMGDLQLGDAAISSPVEIDVSRYGSTSGSSSYRNVYHHYTEEEEDGDYSSDQDISDKSDPFESHITRLHPRDSSFKRKSNDYASVQVAQHPAIKQREQQEQEELLYALELSLVEK